MEEVGAAAVSATLAVVADAEVALADAGGSDSFSPYRGISSTQSRDAAEALPTSTCPRTEGNPNMETSISHTPGARSSENRPSSSVYPTTLAPPNRAVIVAPGRNWSAARTVPLYWAAKTIAGARRVKNRSRRRFTEIYNCNSTPPPDGSIISVLSCSSKPK